MKWPSAESVIVALLLTLAVCQAFIVIIGLIEICNKQPATQLPAPESCYEKYPAIVSWECAADCVCRVSRDEKIIHKKCQRPHGIGGDITFAPDDCRQREVLDRWQWKTLPIEMSQKEVAK